MFHPVLLKRLETPGENLAHLPFLFLAFNAPVFPGYVAGHQPSTTSCSFCILQVLGTSRLLPPFSGDPTVPHISTLVPNVS